MFHSCYDVMFKKIGMKNGKKENSNKESGQTTYPYRLSCPVKI